MTDSSTPPPRATIFDSFRHLLPRAKAWNIVPAKRLRALFAGLAAALTDARAFIDGVLDDLDPQQTRALEAWEAQFALLSTFLTEQQRRDRLAGAWSATGGQSPRYLQDTLQAAGFDVYVHEWWERNLLTAPNDLTNAAWPKHQLTATYNASTKTSTLTTDGGADPYIYSLCSLPGPVGDRTFTFSVWLWTDAGQPTDGQLFVSDGITYTPTDIILTTTPTLYTFSYTFTASTSTVVHCRIDLSSNQPAGKYLYVRYPDFREERSGGTVSGDAPITPRNPFLYLNNGTAAVYPMCDGGQAAAAADNAVPAMDGHTTVLPGYALANRVWADHTATVQRVYTIPADPTKYPFFLYIGGKRFPDQAIVPVARQGEFEGLCLKYRPTENWLGMLITYS